MKTIKQVEVTPVFVEYIPEVLEEGKIYISKEDGVSVHNCLCGCKNKTVLPLGQNEWTLIEKEGKVSFTPSVGQQSKLCLIKKSPHFGLKKQNRNL